MNITLIADELPFILLANRLTIRRFDFNENGKINAMSSTIGGGHDFVHNIEYDAVDEKIYFADIRQKKIKRMNMDGTGTEELIRHDIDGIEGIAFDWITK